MRLLISHGESRSIFYIVDETAPIEEQPAIMASFSSRPEADAYLNRNVPYRAFQMALIAIITTLAMTAAWSAITLIGG